MPSKFAGGALRLVSTFFYFLEFCCAAIGLGVYSYFLAKLSLNDLGIEQRWRAVEGIVGAAVLYTIFAVILTCCLGGNRFFGLLAVVLNVLFCGGMIAVAVITRDGADSCTGFVETPIGGGPSNVDGPTDTNLGFACRLNTAVFATSLVAALLFLISVILQLLIVRNHQKEKKYGPGPANNYTSGSAGRFALFKRKRGVVKDPAYDANLVEKGHTNNGLAAPVAATNGRYSHDTGYTGTTAQTDSYGGANKYDSNYVPGTATYDAPGSSANHGTGVLPGPYDTRNPGHANHAVNY